jgi:hypothetical protein
MIKVLKKDKIDNLLYSYYENNIVVIKPEGYKPSVPIFCPNCSFVMNDSSDNNNYHNFKCCTQCAYKWAESHRKKWLLGWRPSSSEIKKFQKERNSMPISFNLENI